MLSLTLLNMTTFQLSDKHSFSFTIFTVPYCVINPIFEDKIKSFIFPLKLCDHVDESEDVGNDLVEPEYCDGSNSTTSCGTNAYCVMKNETETCQCMRPFKGNPEIGCELECTSDADCPSEYSCYNASRRCVDPCEPSLQIFFKQCGRDAFCKVEDHKSVCYCPQDLPHGDPQVHCKEVRTRVHTRRVHKFIQFMKFLGHS